MRTPPCAWGAGSASSGRGLARKSQTTLTLYGSYSVSASAASESCARAIGQLVAVAPLESRQHRVRPASLRKSSTGPDAEEAEHEGEADLTLDESATTLKGPGDRISNRCAPRQARAVQDHDAHRLEAHPLEGPVAGDCSGPIRTCARHTSRGADGPILWTTQLSLAARTLAIV